MDIYTSGFILEDPAKLATSGILTFNALINSPQICFRNFCPSSLVTNGLGLRSGQPQ